MFLMLSDLHRKAEGTTLVETWRPDNDLTSAALDDSLNYGQAQANTLTVHLCSPLQLTKPVEQFWQIFG